VPTHSASDMLTDSGASATAMSRGIRADNRVIGMVDPAALSSPPSILDFFDRAKDPEVIYKGGERFVVQKTQDKLSALPVAVF
jgi:alkaline phosphatase